MKTIWKKNKTDVPYFLSRQVINSEDLWSVMAASQTVLGSAGKEEFSPKPLENHLLGG